MLRSLLNLAIVACAAAATTPCDASIPGLWRNGGSIFNITWVGAPSAGRWVGVALTLPNAWTNVSASFSVPDMATVDARFSNGHHGLGNVSGGCTSFAWDDGSSWNFAGAAPVGKINVHFAMHTHDDVGWDTTYQRYYDGTGIQNRNVSKILQNVVAGLLRDPKRKFSYVEQAFFVKWWEEQSPAMQATVQGLVASGQLTFLNGGFSMHDEASPSYVDMLDNTAVGQRAIVDNFGLSSLPTCTWQIDPFGHSAFQGVLGSALGGYDGQMWNREDGAFKDASIASQKAERIWTPSRSQPGVAAFQGTFVASGYGSPNNRCDGGSPTSGTGCGAQWAALDAVGLALKVIYEYALAVRGSNVLLLFGTDFTTENAIIEGTPADDKGGYFAYVSALIDELNADKAGRFNAFFSTPAAYVRAKLDEVATLPVYTADFMPYADDDAGHNQWTGYFSSRPSYKGFVRLTSSLHQSARQLQLMAGGPADLGRGNSLFALERGMGVAQHHDSVSGTAQQNVNDDYSLILEGGRAAAYAGAAADAAALTGYSGAPFAPCPLANVSLCPALEAGGAAVALLHNALAQPAAAAPVRLPAGFPAGVASYAVYDSAGAAVPAQLVPLSAADAALRALYGGDAAPTQWLCFTAALPAAGFAAYFVVPAAAAVPSTAASVVAPAAGDVLLTNGRLSLTVAAATGWPSAYADAATGVSLPLAQQWLFYEGFNGKSALNGSTQASGAYIFRPATQSAAPVHPAAAAVTVVTGPVVNMTYHSAGWVSQETRLWAGAASLEVEWTVGPVNVSDGRSREVITRWSSGLATAGAWASDSNCREAQPRLRNSRANYTVKVSEPVSSNFYPTNCLIRTSSPDVTLALAVDRSEAGASLADGALELLVHRRLLYDDHRGVGEPLNEPGLDGAGLIIRGRHWLLAAPAAAAPPAYKALQQQSLALPTTLQLFASLGALSPAAWLAAHNASASALAAPLPPNLHLATLHGHSPTTALLRLAHLYDAGEDAALSAPVSVDLATLLAGRTITAATEMTLPGTQPLARVPQRTLRTDGGATFVVPQLPTPPAGAGLTVTLTAQQIRTFMVTFQ